MIFNYMCPSVGVIARDILRPFGSAKNHYFSHEIVIGLVIAPGPSWFCGQRKSWSFTDAFKRTHLNLAACTTVNDHRQSFFSSHPRNRTATRSVVLASALYRAILLRCGVISYMMMFSGDVSL